MAKADQARGLRQRVSFMGSSDSRSRRKKIARTCLAAVVVVVLAVLGFLAHLPLSAAGPLELLVVLVAALYLGFLEASLASVVAVLCLDYLFTRPLFQFTVADVQNWIALATFETIALIVSRLSSDVRLHARAATEQKQRALTLYELSRAILYIQQNRPIADQLCALIRDVVGVDKVSFWTITDEPSDSPFGTSRTIPAAYDVYLGERNGDDAASRTSTRVLRVGVKPIGGMTLQGWNLDPLMADAVASLAALAFERAHATRRESRVEIERDTEQLRTAVLDGLAHGFKTPLTAIQTASSGLLAVGQLSALQTELISIIDDRVSMLSQLTSQLLQTAALDAKQIRLQRTNVVLGELLDKIIGEQPADSRCRIRLVPPPRNVQDFVDAPLVELALQQLLDNASKYSTPNTEIAITLVHKEWETVISVENSGKTGPTVNSDEMERLFERFYRGAQMEYGPAGTGLGLSVVKKVAEAHGGRAWMESANGMTRFLLSVARLKGEKHG